jgi:hypothetical protein
MRPSLPSSKPIPFSFNNLQKVLDTVAIFVVIFPMKLSHSLARRNHPATPASSVCKALNVVWPPLYFQQLPPYLFATPFFSNSCALPRGWGGGDAIQRDFLPLQPCDPLAARHPPLSPLKLTLTEKPPIPRLFSGICPNLQQITLLESSVDLLSPLKLTLTKNTPVSPLESTLTKSRVWKSPRIILLQKQGEGGCKMLAATLSSGIGFSLCSYDRSSLETSRHGAGSPNTNRGIACRTQANASTPPAASFAGQSPANSLPSSRTALP